METGGIAISHQHRKNELESSSGNRFYIHAALNFDFGHKIYMYLGTMSFGNHSKTERRQPESGSRGFLSIRKKEFSLSQRVSRLWARDFWEENNLQRTFVITLEQGNCFSLSQPNCDALGNVVQVSVCANSLSDLVYIHMLLQKMHTTQQQQQGRSCTGNSQATCARLKSNKLQLNSSPQN